MINIYLWDHVRYLSELMSAHRTDHVPGDLRFVTQTSEQHKLCEDNVKLLIVLFYYNVFFFTPKLTSTTDTTVEKQDHNMMSFV